MLLMIIIFAFTNLRRVFTSAGNSSNTELYKVSVLKNVYSCSLQASGDKTPVKRNMLFYHLGLLLVLCRDLYTLYTLDP